MDFNRRAKKRKLKSLLDESIDCDPNNLSTVSNEQVR